MRVIWLLGLLGLAGCGHVEKDLLVPASEPGPATVAEASDYRATATGAEVVGFLDTIADRSPFISRFAFGQSAEGRPLVGALVARPPVAGPKALHSDQRLVVLILANIHAGECCGKEAVLRLLRELAGRPEEPWLDQLVLLVIPNYNTDGNERVDRGNRPGQVGPVEGMGQRANAQGLDLNRDYVKLETPETRALVQLINRWNPHCLLDLHTTDGSWHQYQLTYDTPHNPAADRQLSEFMRYSMMPDISHELRIKGINSFYYGNFRENNTRWQTADHRPRYGLDYMALRGRMPILSEAYSYITFQERIEATYAFVSECLNYLARHPKMLAHFLDLVQAQTVAAGNQPDPNQPVPIQAQIAPFREHYIVRGYDPPSRPRVTLEEVASGTAPTPPGTPKDYTVAFYGRFEPVHSVRRPFAYLIPAALRRIVDQLRLHGISLNQLEKETELAVEAYRWVGLERAERPYQKHHLATATVSLERETRPIAAGTYVALTGQPLGTLLVYLLEPESDDGLVTWNFFDDHFQVGGEYPILRLPQPAALPLQSAPPED